MIPNQKTSSEKMEFWRPDNAKTEHSTAMRFNSHKVRNLVKLLEILSAMVLVFWSTTRLPIALNLMIEFAKQTCALLLTTPSVFLIGNAIVVTILGTFQSPSDPKPDLYDEFVTESRRRTQFQTQEIEKVEPLQHSASDEAATEVRRCRRTQSERAVRYDLRKELRRSRTGSCRMKMKTTAFGVDDDLSGDEFRRRVEAFIEKQQRFIRDENMTLVFSN